MHKSLLLFFILALTISCNKSCQDNESKEKSAKIQNKTKLILATNSEPDTLNPLFAEMAASSEIYFLGHRELTLYNDDWKLVPDLAVKIPSIENGSVKFKKQIHKGKTKTKMVVSWQIKQDAKWQDGVEVTADDFIFAWKVCLDPTQEIIDRDTCERIEKMESMGENKKTLKVTWKEPFAFFDTYGVHSLLPKHILVKRYYKADGNTRNLKKDKYGQQPFSNGPFKFKKWVPGQYITYVRNDFYKPKAKLQEITFKIMPNNMTIESNLLAGNIDGVTMSGGLNIPQIENIKKRYKNKFKFYSVPGMIWSHIDFNLDNPWLQDVRLRKAIAHTIQRKQISEKIFFGKYKTANTFNSPRHWGHNPNVEAFSFDLEKAAQLLDEAGWVQKGNNVRVNEKGEKLVLHLSSVAGIKDIQQLQQVIKSDMRKVGIELRIDNKPAKVFFGSLARYRKFPHMSFYSWISSPTSWSHTLWHKDQIPSAQNNWQGQNYPGWKNDEASRLLDAIPVQMNTIKRKQMMMRVQEIWAQHLPAVPMYFRPDDTLTHPKLKNYRPTGTITPVTWNAHEWSFE